MKTSERLDRLPPYLFAELERKISEKQAQGIDVISLGIGDPDTPSPAEVVAALAAAGADPSTHRYPSNRGRPEFRNAVADFYERRFGVELHPENEIVPGLGAKETIFNLNLAFLDPGTCALASDPGYPVYSGGPLIAGADYVPMPLVPERQFAPDLGAISAEDAERARLLYINYPNNPTGAVAPDGFFEEVVAFARDHDILVVHDASYTETTFDGYVAPSFLETPGAKEVGVEVFSLSKGWNMTGWRTAAILGNADAVQAYWKLKTNIDSGMFEAVQLAAIAAFEQAADFPRGMSMKYERRRGQVVAALREIGGGGSPPRGPDYILAPGAGGDTPAAVCGHVLEEAAVVVSPGSSYGPSGEGFFRISRTIADERLAEAVERLRSSLSGTG